MSTKILASLFGLALSGKLISVMNIDGVPVDVLPGWLLNVFLVITVISYGAKKGLDLYEKKKDIDHKYEDEND